MSCRQWPGLNVQLGLSLGYGLVSTVMKLAVVDSFMAATAPTPAPAAAAAP